MASAVCSEPSRISISLEGTASASPFPSPSSSFLPPPTPGAHEFAVKPVPPARNGRKSSNGNTSSHPPSPLPPQPTVVPEPDSVNGDVESQAAIPAAASESKPQKSPSQRSSLNGTAEPPQINGTSQSLLVSKESSTSSNINGNGSVPLPPLSPGLISPMTPTPSSIQRQIMPKECLEPPRSPSNFDQPNSSSTTPTIPNAVLPPENGNTEIGGTSSMEIVSDSATTNSSPSSSISSTTTTTKSTLPAVEQEESPLSKIIIPEGLIDSTTPSSGLSSPMFPPNTSKSRPISTISTSSTSADPSLFSNRPAPPSPAMSRRVSGCPSVGSSSARSRPSSTVVSRTNSLRKSTHSPSTSPVVNPHRQSIGTQLNQTFFPPLPSPQNLTFALNVQQPPAGAGAAPSGSSLLSNQPSGSISPASASTPSSGSFFVSTSVPTAQSTSTPSSPSLPTTPISLTTPTPGAAFSTNTPSSRRTSTVVYIKIRDFGFPPSDERHIGLGPEVPKANKVGRMNRRLGGKRSMSQGSVSSSDGDGMEEEEEEDGDGDDWLFGGGARGGFGGFGGRGGYGGGGFSALGRFNWTSGATAADIFETEKEAAAAANRASGGGGGFPSRTDLDRNFLEGDSESGMDDEEEYFDAEGVSVEDEEDEEDTLYPGLYRALYAFEPEGTAEMRLVEDQIVRVVGRGGGVGWAVVVDDSAEKSLDGGGGVNGNAQMKHALVPESYLEPVRLDWEDEEVAAAAA